MKNKKITRLTLLQGARVTVAPPSSSGRGKEFQHDGRVLEILGEGATYNRRLALLASLRALQGRMTFGYARCNATVCTRKSFVQNDVAANQPPTPSLPIGEGEFENASLNKGGGPLAVVGLKRENSSHEKNLLTNLLTHTNKKLSAFYKNPPPTLLYKGGKKAAFTLAEVLITIGIIGVVAAMTLPALIQKHQKQVTVTSLRKFYSILAQAKQLSEAQNGEMEYWQFPNTQTHSDIEPFFDKYFRPYMSVINKCESINDCSSAIYHNTLGVTYTLKDGMQFYFAPNAQTSTLTGNYIYIIVDINGNKAPNRSGRDIFHLDIYPKRGAVMLGQMSGVDNAGNYVREELKNGVPINAGRDTACCSNECATSSYKYHACGALIQADGWEIKDDYPW